MSEDLEKLDDNDGSSKNENNMSEDPEANIAESKASIINDEDVVREPRNPKNTKRHKTGVIYLSRIPTGMTVTKLAEILSQYGELGKIYLKPRDADETKKKARMYTEGWVEFESKRIAKMVSNMLNNKIVDGRRKNPWYGEPWNMKYMKGLKWNDLQGKIAMERKIQESKIRMAIAESKKKVDKFSKDVTREKLLKKLESEGKTVRRYDRPLGHIKVTKPWKERSRPQNDNFLTGLLMNGMT